MFTFLFRPLKMGKNFVFRSVLIFLVLFTTNNDQTGLRDITY